ncbi:hypothetical protein HL658_34910 [Azospirillum sp. RWY-5-1]|uniref:Glycosyltransferase n=1 Tax=Azospirillum oleiclasticum TaxID=2735135 RepID=A0ABX2TKD7_9PROT|nr:glycosyltransferase [Azospirillum oleiclasticum]NYZ17764.1 hypothetical protein [Azospirillum oleiclasticum]NYZ24190.1 hypothetical protein [Azospirillum oleiclasticum]
MTAATTPPPQSPTMPPIDRDRFAGTVLITDIPPCANYSGGIFLDQILASIDYGVRHAVVILNPELKPEVTPRAAASMRIERLSKPHEFHDPTVLTTGAVRERELGAAATVDTVIVPQLVAKLKAIGATSLWVLLEGQTLIRVAHQLQRVTSLPMTVQVMDPPTNWLRAHGVDPTTTAELLDQYDAVIRGASAVAAASWAMAELYQERHGTPSFAVVPSLSQELARPPAAFPSGQRPFRIAVAGQIYARDEWYALTRALDQIEWRVDGRTIEIHAFTRDPIAADLIALGHVVCRRWLPTPDLIGALQDMDLVYCPYRFGEPFREEATLCFPSKLTTYLALGRPVLFHGPRYASPAKFLAREDAAFTWHSMDPDELGGMLAGILRDPDAYARVAAAGRRLFDATLTDRHLASAIAGALLAAVPRTPHDNTDMPAAGRPPVILVVAFGSSVHTARWMNMVTRSGFRFVLCPTVRLPLSEDFRAVRTVRDAANLDGMAPGELGCFDLDSVDEDEIAAVERGIGYQAFVPSFASSLRLASPAHVVAAVRRFAPVAVHSMEVQFAGYMTLGAKDVLGRAMPPWLLSNWGSDIYLYRKLAAHQDRLARIARSIDAYLAECERDVGIVRAMGFAGPVGPTMPASGGIDFAGFPPLDSFEPPSRRREIHVKGYHGWSGRGLHILAAVHLAAPALDGFRIRVMLAGPEVAEMVRIMRERDGLDIACEPYLPTYLESIRRLGRARVAIGLGISDGISTTLLESMAVGAFPIKGSSSCADEWIRDRTGFIVSPHDTRAMADALVRAATDDALVDAAAPVNRRIVEERWDGARNSGVFLRFLQDFLGIEAPPAPEPAAPEPVAAPPAAVWPPAEPLEPRHLVDAGWYRAAHAEALAPEEDAAEHFLLHGWRRGVDPNPWFSTRFYLAANPAVADAGICPLVDFVGEGAAQGRRPHPIFDVAWYSERYLGSRPPTPEALRHFLTVGLAAGAVPNPLLDRPGVRERVAAVPVADRNAALPRLLEERQEQDRRLRTMVDESWYRGAYPDATATGIPPVAHFLYCGWFEGRVPNAALDRLEVHRRLLAAPPVDRSAVLLRLAAGDLGDPDPLVVLVDEDWYRSAYPDVAAAGVAPAVHYVHHGWRERRDPNPWFSTSGYLSAYPDVAEAKLCPLLHFVQRGAAEGRRPHPAFDIVWYSRRYLGSEQPTAEALIHFLTVGRGTGAVPNEPLDRPAAAAAPRAAAPRAAAGVRPEREEEALLLALVDADWYRTAGSGTPVSAADALRHYREEGWRQGLDPNPWFSTTAYRSAHPDADAGLCPLVHFVRQGAERGHRPHPGFDIVWYGRHHLGADRPTAEALRHFLTIGLAAGAVPDPDLHGPAVQDRLLATPPAERTALIGRLQEWSARAAAGPLDWEVERASHGEDAGLLAVWLTRGLARQTSPVLILCDGADAIAQARLAARVLPLEEAALFGMVGPDGALVIGDGVTGLRLRLPYHTEALKDLLTATGVRRAAALAPALCTGPVARGIRDARIPLPAEPSVPGWS